MLNIGIQIEEYGIYAVLLKSAKEGRPELVDYTFLPLSLDHLSKEQKKNELSLKLKELSKKYPPHHHHFIFSIPQQHITVHDLRFPFKEKFRINQALPYEIANLLPLSLDKIVYSSKISFQNKNFSQILTFIADKKWVHDFLEPLHHAGIQPFILTPESSALINLFEDWSVSPPQINDIESLQADKLKIFLSYQNSSALILSKNRIIQSYDLNWGIQHCVKDISAKYRRSMDQALDYFHKNAFLKKEDSHLSHFAPLSKIIHRSFSDLSHQIRLLIIHLQSLGYGSMNEIIIFGPGSHIQNLTYHLFNIFKAPVKKLEQHELFSIPTEYLPALGAAIEGFKKPRNPPINLIQHFKSSSEEMIKISKQRQNLIKSSALIFILFLSYAMTRDWRSSYLENHINKIFSTQSRKIAKLGTRDISIENVEKFLKNKDKVQKKYTLFKNLSQYTPSPLKNLNLIIQSLDDPDLWELELSEVEINGPQVILSGFIHPNHLNAFKTNLQSIALNQKINDDSKEKLKEKKSSAEKIIKPSIEEILQPSENMNLFDDDLTADQPIEKKPNKNLVFFYLTFKM